MISTAAATAATAGTASTSVRRQVNRRGGAGAPADDLADVLAHVGRGGDAGAAQLGDEVTLRH